MSRIGLIIQARMGSTRLPGKVLMPIAGRPLLDHIIERLRGLRAEARLVVATSDEAQDDAIFNHCERRGVACFRGSEADVLARYFHCAVRHGFDQVVRLTGDNPFIDVEELDRLIELHLASGNDFTQSFEALPVGIGAEIFTFVALARSYHEGRKPHHREHVDEYILENPEIFKSGALEVEEGKRRPEIRLTVDTEEDFCQACRLAEAVDGGMPRTEEAIRLCLQSV